MGFNIVARVKQGARDWGYDIKNDSGAKIRVDKAFAAYLAGKNQLNGVTAAIVNDDLLFRNIPDNIPIIRRAANEKDRHTVTAILRDGKKAVGACYDGNEAQILYAQFEDDALKGLLRNVKAIRSKGKVLFNGTRTVPNIQISEIGTPANAPASEAAVPMADETEAKHTVTSLVKVGRSVIGAHYDNGTELISRKQLEEDALAHKLSNLTAQSYQGKVLFRGARNITVEVQNTETADSKLSKSEEKLVNEDKLAVTQLIRDGRKIIGACYTGMKFDGKKAPVSRAQLEADALSNKLSNLKAQNYHGKVLFRGGKNIPVVSIQ